MAQLPPPLLPAAPVFSYTLTRAHSAASLACSAEAYVPSIALDTFWWPHDLGGKASRSEESTAHDRHTHWAV